jgi:hypothetical protein
MRGKWRHQRCPEAVLRKPSEVSIKVLVQMNRFSQCEIFGTHDRSLPIWKKVSNFCLLLPITIKMKGTWTSQENYLSIWSAAGFFFK